MTHLKRLLTEPFLRLLDLRPSSLIHRLSPGTLITQSKSKMEIAVLCTDCYAFFWILLLRIQSCYAGTISGAFDLEDPFNDGIN